MPTTSISSGIILNRDDIGFGFANNYEVGFGIVTGTDIPTGSTIYGISVSLNLHSGAVTVQGKFMSRPNSGDLNAAYEDSGDTQVSPDWMSVNVDQLPFSIGEIGSVYFPLPSPTTVSANSYYLLVRVLDSSSTPIEFDAASEAGITTATTFQSGWYKTTGSWEEIPSGYCLCVNVYGQQEVLNQTSDVTTPREEGVGTRIFGGRLGYWFDNSTPKTFRSIFTLASQFSAVRVILAQAGTADVVIGKCAVAPLETAANFALSDVAWRQTYFEGQESGTILSAISKSRTFLFSDWIDVGSLPRTDTPGALPMLAVSAYVETPIVIQGLLGYSDSSGDQLLDLTNWASHPTRPHVMRYNDGDSVLTPTDFTSTTNISVSPIVGIQYRALGKVITVFCYGNSISEALGDTYVGSGFGLRACDALQSPLVSYEYGNMAWSGSTPDFFVKEVQDSMYAGIYPDIAFIPSGSPNGITAPITSTNITFAKTNSLACVGIARTYGVQTIIWTWIPANYSDTSWGSSDSLRVAYNDVVRAYAGTGINVADFDAKLAGVAEAHGQIEFLSGTTNDGLHPNPTGNADLALVAEAAIVAVLPMLGVQLGTLITA